MTLRSAPLLVGAVTTLQPFVDAGVVDAAGAHVAAAVGRSTGDERPEVLLAAALAVRAVQLGHVCVVLTEAAATVVPDGVADAAAADGRFDGADGAGTTGLDDHLFDGSTAALPWPDPATWVAALHTSAAVSVLDPTADLDLDPGPAQGPDGAPLRPLVLWGDRLYLERYWRYERAVGDDLLARAARAAGDGAALPAEAVRAVLDRAFGSTPSEDDRPPGDVPPDRQRQAAEVALTRGLAVVAGGPGTGKTHTVARLLAAAHDLARAEGRPLEVALAAPTGKAAARMTEAVHLAVDGAGLDERTADALLAVEASTIHRLLGSLGSGGFRHDRSHPLPHDVVVIDETSMVALPLMARLLDAVRPDARVVLVGDPYQLASVEAGAVLGDLVGPAAEPTDPTGPTDPTEPTDPTGPTGTAGLRSCVVVLERAHRFAEASGIAALADAVRTGDTDRALAVLRDPDHPDAVLVDPEDPAARRRVEAAVTANATAVVEAARAGETGSGLARCADLKVLCAARRGRNGRRAWTALVEDHLERTLSGVAVHRRWYTGRPVIVTRNDPLTGVANGDTGLVVDSADGPVVAFPTAGDPRVVSTARLDAIDTWWSMTIHKSQGSEFTHAVVALPLHESPLLTRELLYTGVTRAREQVTVVATDAALRRAIERPVARASGLGARLWAT